MNIYIYTRPKALVLRRRKHVLKYTCNYLCINEHMYVHTGPKALVLRRRKNVLQHTALWYAAECKELSDTLYTRPRALILRRRERVL